MFMPETAVTSVSILGRRKRRAANEYREEQEYGQQLLHFCLQMSELVADILIPWPGESKASKARWVSFM